MSASTISNSESQPNIPVLNCHKCASKLTPSDRFCSSCGSARSIARHKKLTLKQMSLIGILGLAIAGAGYSLQPWLQGSPPTQAAKQSVSPSTQTSMPLSAEELLTQAESAMQKLIESQSPEPAQILEAVDLLSRILSADPENAWALLQMAELSFEQRIFDKSSDFYARYLKLAPQDNVIRTRYASSLTFSGKAEQALTELDTVLAADPNNFQANAFAAIANQEAGHQEKAQSMLTKAILLAPNDEAKNRLLKFSETLQQKAKEGGQTNVAAPQSSSPIRGNIADNSFGALDTFLKNHPIAGPKYRDLSVQGTEIRLSFADFPMDKMPPFVKEKFSSNVALEAGKLTKTPGMTVVFLDVTTGAELHRVAVTQ